MKTASYTTLNTVFNSIDQEAFATLLISSKELDNPSPSDPDNSYWMIQTEELLLSSKLRPRKIDWSIIYENLSSLLHEAGTLEDALILASKDGLLEEVSILLEAGIDPSTRNNAAIVSATRENRVDVVILLLSSPLVDPTVNNNSAYRIANRDGFYQLADVLGSDSRVRSLIT